MEASLLIWVLLAIFCVGSAILADHALLLARPVTVLFVMLGIWSLIVALPIVLFWRFRGRGSVAESG